MDKFIFNLIIKKNNEKEKLIVIKLTLQWTFSKFSSFFNKNQNKKKKKRKQENALHFHNFPHLLNGVLTVLIFSFFFSFIQTLIQGEGVVFLFVYFTVDLNSLTFS